MPDLLEGAEPPVTLADEIAEVRRELRLRYRHYPRWIEAGKMTEAEARRHIAVLDAVLTRLIAIEAVERRRRAAMVPRTAAPPGAA